MLEHQLLRTDTTYAVTFLWHSSTFSTDTSLHIFPFATRVNGVSCGMAGLLARAVGWPLQLWTFIYKKKYTTAFAHTVHNFTVSLLIRQTLFHFHLPDCDDVVAVGWGLTEEGEASEEEGDRHNTSNMVHSLICITCRQWCFVRLVVHPPLHVIHLEEVLPCAELSVFLIKWGHTFERLLWSIASGHDAFVLPITLQHSVNAVKCLRQPLFYNTRPKMDQLPSENLKRSLTALPFSAIWKKILETDGQMVWVHMGGCLTSSVSQVTLMSKGLNLHICEMENAILMKMSKRDCRKQIIPLLRYIVIFQHLLENILL